MRVEIFDVDHGQCAVVTAPNGERMMIDCGVLSDGDAYWWPSIHYLGERFALLALTNLDEDHAEDFASLVRRVRIERILSNPTVGYWELLALKKDGMMAGVQTFARWLGGPKVSLPDPNFGNVSVRWYYNRYALGIMDNTNDLSMVIIVQFGAFNILFSGDMENAGWRSLLQLPAFVIDLIGVNVFVASHHGRESGCLAELFEGWMPEIFVISDGTIEYETQETTQWYRARARGIPVRGTNDRRFVYTTRNDGSMRIDVGPAGRWLLSHIQPPIWPAKRSA